MLETKYVRQRAYAWAMHHVPDASLVQRFAFAGLH
jgi:hypothetical protein